MVLKTASSIFTTSIPQSLKTHSLTSRKLSTTPFYVEFRKKKQLEIKNKILEKTGFDQVFDDNNTIDGNNYSDYNSIKDAVHSKLRYG